LRGKGISVRIWRSIFGEKACMRACVTCGFADGLLAPSSAGSGVGSARAGAPHGFSQGVAVPRKMSVFPNVVGHCVITFGFPAVPARKASTAAHGLAFRESVQTA